MTFFLSFTLTWLIIKISIPFLRNYFLDQPNHRSLHKNDKPTGAGILFSLVISVYYILDKNYIPLLCLPLAITGLIDDRFNISQKLRFSVQIFTALLLILNSETYQNNIFQSTFLVQVMIVLFLAISIVSIINFINFMDGLDGLVGSNLIIIFISIGLISDLNTNIIVGALVGFLIWNWSPAKVFMGDAGSTFLGALFSGFVLQMNKPTDMIGVLLVSAPLMVDAFICVIRRLFDGQNIFLPHKSHLYQRLYQGGLGKSRICFIYIVSSFIILSTLMGLGIYFAIVSLIFISFAGIYLDKKFAVDF
tara:strand:- start:65 stop:982 length:918 start_codon:yes stop_codon:yes gene_type:complete